MHQRKLIPKGLKLLLEPTIGNHNHEFVDNWYSKLKQFFLISMEYIVEFCDNTLITTTQEIITTESLLKTSTNKNRLQKLKAKIMKNEELSKKS